MTNREFFGGVIRRHLGSCCETLGVSQMLLQACTLLALGLSLSVCTVDAQAVTLRLHVRGTDGSPIAGALVAAIDSLDKIAAEGLTNERGLKAFSVSPGVYRIRVRRIGYVPYTSRLVSAGRDEVVTVEVESRRVELSTIVVLAKTSCTTSALNNESVSTVWEEVAKGLRTSQLAVSDLAGLQYARLYRRQVDNRGRVSRNDSATIVITEPRPFWAADPSILARRGYIQGNLSSGLQYFGPDESAILSKDFVDTHCFRLVRDPLRTGEIGIQFNPIRGRKVPDVTGTLWVDEKSAELREIKFSHFLANLPAIAAASGFTKFKRMHSGSWIVGEWQIRIPLLSAFGRYSRDIAVVGFSETGGVILENVLQSSGVDSASEWAAGAERPTPPLTGVWANIAGTVRDVSGAPIAEAEVIVGDQRATSDKDGRFTLPPLPTGRSDILIRRLGFIPGTLSFVIQPDQPKVTVTATLAAVPTTLSTIIISGKTLDSDLWRNGFYRRKDSGAGVFFEDSTVSKASNLSDLIRQVANVKVVTNEKTGTRIPTSMEPRFPVSEKSEVSLGRLGTKPTSSAGFDNPVFCALRIYMDGKLLPWASVAGIDNVTSPRNVKAIEVYSRTRDVPTALVGGTGSERIDTGITLRRLGMEGGGPECGAILMWTK